ncbi:MAG: ATP-binding cassette domain-containing protein [Hyphomonas sp.]
MLSLIGRAQLAGGTIDIDGTPLAAGGSLADSIAYLGQTPWLMEGTIRDNIAIAAPHASAADLEDAAAQAGIFDFTDTLDRPLARFGAGLSGGQRQRIALARALLRKSPILLMDEPTAHLDPDAEQDLIEKIKSLAASRTIILATHSPALTEAADTIIPVATFKAEVAA